MSNYIDANKLTAIIESNAYELTDKHNSYGVGMFVGGIFQAMEEAEVEADAEVKHGHWYFTEYEYFSCSVCGKSYYSGCESSTEAQSHIESGISLYKYCPNCGAAMDGERT